MSYRLTANKGKAEVLANTDSPDVSIIVPTFQEAKSLPHLLARIERVIVSNGLSAELLIMDDDSRDGTGEVVRSLGLPWVRLIIRTENHGLSLAVLDGFMEASGERLVVMDADLSHPPEKLPELLEALKEGYDFVIGSRQVPGSSVDEHWTLSRWLNSFVATLLALPLTSARDPMSGYFALHRSAVDRADHLNPVGYKIGLELMVKCHLHRIKEVPIHFNERLYGSSKLSWAERWRYVKHLRRLYLYKYCGWTYLAQFIVVGVSGTLVNLGVLTGLLLTGVSLEFSLALAIAISMLSNFLLNRRFTFSYAHRGPLVKQLLQFCGACSFGAIVNYAITLMLLTMFHPNLFPQLAALGGISGGMMFNFLSSRFLVFRQYS